MVNQALRRLLHQEETGHNCWERCLIPKVSSRGEGRCGGRGEGRCSGRGEVWWERRGKEVWWGRERGGVVGEEGEGGVVGKEGEKLVHTKLEG